MLNLNIQNETSRLRAVVLGSVKNNGPVPKLEDCYDPKSAEHVAAGTYPKIEDMVLEMEAVAKVFEKYHVKVFRPNQIENYNQIFTRDIAFVIEDKFIKANILPDRAQEIDAIQYVIDQIAPENLVTLPEEAHVEGGDVMSWNEYIFVGTYSGYDAGTSFQTNTTVIVIVTSVGFILAGIYLLTAYLKNRKILKRAD